MVQTVLRTVYCGTNGIMNGILWYKRYYERYILLCYYERYIVVHTVIWTIRSGTDGIMKDK